MRPANLIYLIVLFLLAGCASSPRYTNYSSNNATTGGISGVKKKAKKAKRTTDSSSTTAKNDSNTAVNNEKPSAPENGRQPVISAPPEISLTMAFSEPSGTNILNGEDTGTISLTITNSGKGDALGLTAELVANKQIYGLYFDKRVEIGTIPSGKTIVKEISLKTSDILPSETIGISISVKESNGFDAEPMMLSFKTKSLEPPKLSVVDIGISDQNGSSKVEPGKIVETTVRIQNLGHGNANGVTANLQLGNNVFLAGDSRNSFDLGRLPSGQFRDIKFSFYTNNRILNGQKIPISIKLSEARPRFSTSQQLALTMNAPLKSVNEFVVKASEDGPKGNIQIAGGLSVDVDQEIPEGVKAGKYDVAVIIGNRNYSSSGSPNIDYANRDAQIMRDYVARTMGFDPANIIYAEDATLTKFYEIFGTDQDYKGNLFKWIRPGKSRVFVYYVGHGAPDAETSEAYFVPVDANPQMLKISGYKLQTFYDNLSKLGAQKVTVVIDACFSGATPKGSLFKGTSALVRQEKTTSKPSNALVITSSSGEQFSSWYPEKRHSLFTYYYLKGLQGEADANRDGKITASEMRAYLNETVPYQSRKLTGNEQLPQIHGDDADVLVTLKR